MTLVPSLFVTGADYLDHVHGSPELAALDTIIKKVEMASQRAGEEKIRVEIELPDLLERADYTAVIELNEQASSHFCMLYCKGKFVRTMEEYTGMRVTALYKGTSLVGLINPLQRDE